MMMRYLCPGRRTMFFSALCFFLSCLLLPQLSHAQVFSLNPTAVLPGIEGSVAWGDYDNDGDLDILLAGDSSGTRICRVYRNDGGGIFTDINAGLPGITGGDIKWGDYDNDGDLDIVLAGDTGSGFITRIYRNNGGSFTDINAGLQGVTNAAVAWGDYDGDGDLDLAVTGNNGTWQTRTIYGNNNGIFVNTGAAQNYGVESGDLAWADYDNDGDQDLLVVGNYIGSGFLMIFRNDMKALNYANSPQPGVMESSAAWGDYDNDGDLDIVASGIMYGGTFVTNIFRNNGNNSFTNINAGLPGVAYGTVSWGDYDNDGDLDLLLTGRNQSNIPLCHVYRNDNGVFTNLNAGLPGVSGSSARWGDYDNDGDLDIVLAGNDGATQVTQVWINNTTTANTPPAPPTGLTRIGKQLFWNRASDAETPQAGLTYNVVVSTTSPNVFALSPMADVTTGYRRIPAPGAVQHSTATVVTGLVPGVTYYWSVQTIDAGYRGSVFATSGSFTYEPEFVRVTTAVFTGVDYGSFAWGDYDNDGDLDGLLTGSVVLGGSATTSLYRNNGSGSFTSISTNLPNLYNSSVAWGDYDNDGDLDIVAIGYNTATYPAVMTSRIYRNDGGTFTDINAGLPGVHTGTVAWGDYDNDGDLDLLLMGQTGQNSWHSDIYRNDGGVFTGINAGLPEIWMGTAAWGDYDSDGDLDLVISGAVMPGFTSISRIYRNDGGKFADINAGLQAGYLSSVAWGDYDNDGDLDLLLSGAANSYYTTIYRNDNGSFININAGLPALYSGSAAWGDYDNDGDLDIAFTGVNGPTSSFIYRNDGGLFVNTYADLPGAMRGTVAWGDYDNDGDLDIMLTGFSASNVNIAQLWENKTTSANTVPLAPTGLRLSRIGIDGVQLSWDRASDSQTPQAGLSYSVMIGTTTAGIGVQSPMADVTTGYRRVVTLGTEQMTTSTMITGLTPGTTYYWQVQAIDGAYAGSAFSTIGSFTFTPVLSSTSTSGLPVIVTGATMWGDYDNDGDLDILIAGYTGTGHISGVYRNDGDGNFTDLNAGLPGVSGEAVAWSDYDNDGDLDILIAGTSTTGNICSIYRNDGGIFADISAGLETIICHAAAWGDYDNDGDLDLLLAGMSNGSPITRLYRNENGSFIDSGISTFTGVEKSALAWGDYDNDGDLDVLIERGSMGIQMSVFSTGTTMGAFSTLEPGLQG
jgi:hypothetical protein